MAWVAVLLLALVWPFASIGLRQTVGVQVVQWRPLVQSVVVTATAQTPHRASIGAQMAGQIHDVLVLEGDVVQAGQVLVRLDDREVRAAADAAAQAVAQAQLRQTQWHEVIAPQAEQNARLAQANLAQARSQYERQQRLFATGFIGQAALDDAERAFKVVLAQASVADAQRRANLAGGLEQRLVDSAQAQARSALAAARTRLSYATVRAPFAGRVVQRVCEPGDMVQAGKLLLVLAPDQGVELIAQVDERHLPLLREGLLANASADAFVDQPFVATVSSISPGVDPQRGSVQVKLAVIDAPDFIRQDMTVSVAIEVVRKDQAVVVPRDAVHEAAGQAAWVWMLDADSRVLRTPVKIGLREAGWLEVASGLKPGERIVAEQSIGLRDRQRVRERPR